MHRAWLVALLLVAAVPAAAEDLTSGKRKAIGRLLDLTVGADLVDPLAEQLERHFIQTLRTANPNVSPRALEIVEDEAGRFVRETIAPELREQTVRLFAERFSEAEVRKLIDFYRTPAGAKFVEAMPELLEASAAAGRELVGARLSDVGGKIRARLEEEDLLVD